MGAGGRRGLCEACAGSAGGLAYQMVRRDRYNVLARGPEGITDVLLSERSRAGDSCYTLLERRSVDGTGI